MVVLKYLVKKFRMVLSCEDLGEGRGYFKEILSCLEASNEFMTALYNSGLFISSLRLRKVVRCGRSMLSSYSTCAGLAFERGLARFKYNPKYHMMCHIILALKEAMDRDCHPLNPVATSCQMAEDFSNRVATLTRVVNSRTLPWRTFDLYKMAVSDALKEA